MAKKVVAKDKEKAKKAIAPKPAAKAKAVKKVAEKKPVAATAKPAPRKAAAKKSPQSIHRDPFSESCVGRVYLNRTSADSAIAF